MVTPPGLKTKLESNSSGGVEKRNDRASSRVKAKARLSIVKYDNPSFAVALRRKSKGSRSRFTSIVKEEAELGSLSVRASSI